MSEIFENAKELSHYIDEYIFVLQQDENTEIAFGYKNEYDNCIVGCFVAGEQLK